MEKISFEQHNKNISMESLWKLWEDFGDIPVDDNDCIDQKWQGWGKGTPKMNIWHWFDKKSDGVIPPR